MSSQQQVSLSSLPSSSSDNNNSKLSLLNVGFIGTGAMNGAIIYGLIKSSIIKSSQIYGYDASDKILNECVLKNQIQKCKNSNDLIQKCQVIILGVKPQYLNQVLNECQLSLKQVLKEKREILLISIAAGYKLTSIYDQLNNLLKNELLELQNNNNNNELNNLTKYIKLSRVMPNICCMVSESASGYIMHPLNNNDIKYKEIVEIIFSKIGKCVFLTDENYLDCVTGLSGSGPAFVFMFIEALADGGVFSGLSRETSLILASQTVLGSAKLLLESKSLHPGQLKDQVMSPNGTTARGIKSLEDGNFRSTVMNAVINAFNRSVELGNPIKNSKL